MPLYGNELREELTPFDVGLGRVVKLDTPRRFVGGEALTARAARGERFGRTLVGIRVTGRGIARHGYEVRRPGGVTLVNNHAHHNRSAAITVGEGAAGDPARDLTIAGNRLNNNRGPGQLPLRPVSRLKCSFVGRAWLPR